MKELTKEQKESYKNARLCWICNKKFINNQNFKKVRDHDHYTGNYRGAAHSLCNLRYKEQRNITIGMHNGSNYDFHLIIKELAKEFDTLNVIPENTEKYICFSIPMKTETTDNDYEITYNLRFIDTNRFLTRSLANAVEDLSKLNKPIKCKKCLERKNKYDSYLLF